jgi:hypothetical protein
MSADRRLLRTAVDEGEVRIGHHREVLFRIFKIAMRTEHTLVQQPCLLQHIELARFPVFVNLCRERLPQLRHRAQYWL